jgi:hypothetical protein
MQRGHGEGEFELEMGNVEEGVKRGRGEEKHCSGGQAGVV